LSARRKSRSVSDVETPRRESASANGKRGMDGSGRGTPSARRFTLDLNRQIECGPEEEGKYESLRQLGRGAFGSVHLVKSKKDSLLHALKTVNYNDRNHRENVQKEIQILVRLNHPLIVMLHDLYTSNDGKAMNMIMTYCNGGDLSKLIKAERKNKEGKLDHNTKLYNVQNFLRWFAMSCLGLHYLHENNIIHRDIKPENIFLDASSKNCRLGDFGLAKILEGDAKATAEVGTTFYISPEIVSNSGYSYPTDVWSLGCVMYELVTLQLPYWGANLKEFVSCLMYQERNDAEMVLKCPDEVWAIILRMLDKDSSTRITIPEILASR